MVVCKFFLQGTCRFGENCKFEHQYNDNQLQHYSSLIKQQNFNANTKNGTGAPVDTATLVRSVTNDMVSIEKSGQWLLSCYAPFKEKSLFPGFADHSFEEIRYGYYDAKYNGTIDAYIQQLNMLLQEAVMRIKSLQNPSQEAIMILRAIFDENVQPTSSVLNNSSPSVFGNTQNNIFSNTSTNTSNFMQQGNTNVFNSNPHILPQNSSAQSIFAAANQSLFSGSQPSVFGNTNQNIFGNVQQSNSPLGPSFQQSQTFGNDKTFTSGGLLNTSFSSNSNPTPFGSTVQSNTFVTQQPSIGASVVSLSSNNSNSPLTVQQNINTTFNAPVSQNTLPDNLNSTFINTLPPMATSNVPNSENVFNSNISQSNFNVNPLDAVDESIYSKLEDLSESDIKSYQADAFEFGKIPEKPPHNSMC